MKKQKFQTYENVIVSDDEVQVFEIKHHRKTHERKLKCTFTGTLAREYLKLENSTRNVEKCRENAEYMRNMKQFIEYMRKQKDSVALVEGQANAMFLNEQGIPSISIG